MYIKTYVYEYYATFSDRWRESDRCNTQSAAYIIHGQNTVYIIRVKKKIKKIQKANIYTINNKKKSFKKGKKIKSNTLI